MKPHASAFVLAAFLLVFMSQGPALGDQGTEQPEKAKKAEKAGEEVTVVEPGIHYLEIVTPDSEAARDFYSQAYGLKFSDATPELGNAYFATLPGGSLIGIRAPLRTTEEPIVRTYLRVSDIHAATRRAEELGATIALGPTEIAGRGQIAIYLLGGIEQGIWQTP